MNAADWLVIGAYGLAVLGIGLWAGRGHQSAADHHLGRRRLPVWAVLCSMLATELSAATFIGVPHASYSPGGTWSYLQFAFGALAGKIVLARTLIPIYHRLGVITVYGFIEQRFGPLARRATALCFLCGRVLASGVRLFIAAIAFSVVTGAGVEASIIIAAALAGAYTFIGGIRAVVWTDTLQGAIFLVAAIATIGLLALGVPGGLGGILEWASGEGRLQVFSFPSFLPDGTSGEATLGRLAEILRHIGSTFLGGSRPFLTAFIGGLFLTLATHGTDHDMVQRLLTTRDGAGGSRALVLSGLFNFPLTAVFLFIGTGLAAWYATHTADYSLADAKRILPIFVLHEMPAGLRGLIFAGLFAAAMSSLDSAICAIATTWSVDILKRTPGEKPLLRRTRLASLIFCALLALSALGFAHYDSAFADGSQSLVEFALSAMTIVYGGLLGAFLLALVGRGRGNERSVVLGLGAGVLVGLTLFLQPVLWGKTFLAWPWWIVISAAISFGVAALGRGSSREQGGPLPLPPRCDPPLRSVP
ncbi:MAG: sodium/solute symporter [Planctomycetota bacterium]